MNQITLNLNTIRQKLEMRIERIWIERRDLKVPPSPAAAFCSPGVSLLGDEEPLVSVAKPNANFLGTNEQHEGDEIPDELLDPSDTEYVNNEPAVSERSFLWRMLSNFGLR